MSQWDICIKLLFGSYFDSGKIKVKAMSNALETIPKAKNDR